MKRYGKILASTLAMSVTLLPLQGNANVAGFTQLPAMQTQLDTPAANEGTQAADDYSAMTRKDCAALKNHRDKYSDTEYKGRAAYCKSMKKHHAAKKKKSSRQTQVHDRTDSGGTTDNRPGQ